MPHNDTCGVDPAVGVRLYGQPGFFAQLARRRGARLTFAPAQAAGDRLPEIGRLDARSNSTLPVAV